MNSTGMLAITLFALGFLYGFKILIWIYESRIKRFLTHLCDTNVIDCHSAEEIVKKWEEWGKKIKEMFGIL